jgi:hypothetical protein
MGLPAVPAGGGERGFMAAKRSVVAVVKTKPETVLEDYVRLCELAGLKETLPAGHSTILKDNISWHFPFPGANTTPWQLEGTILALQAAGLYDEARQGHPGGEGPNRPDGPRGEVVCVQNKTVVTNAFKGEDLNKYVPLFRRYKIPVMYNFDPGDMTWSRYEPRGKMLVLDQIFNGEILIPDYFHGTNIVQLPTVKCHIYTTTTGAMKNAFGGLLNINRHWTHTHIHKTLVDLLTIQKEIHSGIFAVMDGTTAGNGPGPRTMIPVIKDYLLASADQVAIDAIAAKMMGFDPMRDLEYVRVASEMGLGMGDPKEIDLVGDDISNESWGFRVGDNGVSRVGDLLWFGPLKRYQNLFTRTPMVRALIFGSEAYHDYFRWPVKDKAIFERWKRETHWGRLFDEYPER